MATETPDYIVKASVSDKIELRDYPPSLIAMVTVEGDRDDAASAAFRILAGFIFGANVEDEKIAMTAPVVQKPLELIAASAGATQWDVHFIMPSKYTLDTLPTPEDSRITILQKPAYSAVAIRFSGTGNKSNLAKHNQRLDDAMAQAGMIATSEPIYAFYNAPFVPSFLRRNEVMYEVLPQEGQR